MHNILFEKCSDGDDATNIANKERLKQRGSGGWMDCRSSATTLAVFILGRSTRSRKGREEDV